MALKAGLVGVNPKGVDKNGMPKTDTAAISAEVDAIAANLKANNKDFVFAYDGTSQKYGYKAGADGDFVPFDAAGSGIGIMVSDPITTGIELPETGVTIVSGGYEIDTESNTAVIGMKLHNTTGSQFNMKFPFKPSISSNKGDLIDMYKSSDFDIPNFTSARSASYTIADDTKTLVTVYGEYAYLIGVIRLATS